MSAHEKEKKGKKRVSLQKECMTVEFKVSFYIMIFENVQFISLFLPVSDIFKVSKDYWIQKTKI